MKQIPLPIKKPKHETVKSGPVETQKPVAMATGDNKASQKKEKAPKEKPTKEAGAKTEGTCTSSIWCFRFICAAKSYYIQIVSQNK